MLIQTAKQKKCLKEHNKIAKFVFASSQSQSHSPSLWGLPIAFATNVKTNKIRIDSHFTSMKKN